jgi:hypothetical protein
MVEKAWSTGSVSRHFQKGRLVSDKVPVLSQGTGIQYAILF